MSSVTIRDVARLAGVGVATVSRVLNNSQNVREQTRKRVLAAIEDLNYVPNIAARQLSGGKTMTVGIATPYLTLPAFTERLEGIQHALWDSRYDLVLHSVRSPMHLESKLDALLTQNRVDGILLLSPPVLDESLWEINPEMPVVVLDSLNLVGRYPTIAIEDENGGRLAAQYLVDKGHRRIGFIGDELESDFGSSANKLRYDGFRDVLFENDIPLNPDWVQFGLLGQRVAREQAATLLDAPQRPTAIFVTSDAKAFVVIEAARERGLRVPEDLAVIGFDDIVMSRNVGLTTICQHLYETGRQSAELLLSWLHGADIDPTLEIFRSVDIVERDTV